MQTFHVKGVNLNLATDEISNPLNTKFYSSKIT